MKAPVQAGNVDNAMTDMVAHELDQVCRAHIKAPVLADIQRETLQRIAASAELGALLITVARERELRMLELGMHAEAAGDAHFDATEFVGPPCDKCGFRAWDATSHATVCETLHRSHAQTRNATEGLAGAIVSFVHTATNMHRI